MESISKRVTVLKENSQANSNNLKALQTSIESDNINSCLSRLENLKETIDLLKKTSTKQAPPTITTTNLCKSVVDETKVNPSNIVSTKGQTLINQLKDWQLRKSNLIIYNMPETVLVNKQGIKADLLSKFKELIADKCNVTIETKDIVSIYRLGSRSDTDPKDGPILVKFVNTPLKFKLIKNASHLKNTSYSISIDKTIEERNSYKALFNQKKELEKGDMSGEWKLKMRGVL